MLKSYSQFCGSQGALCHTPSPHGLIPPPIKRSRFQVSGGVVINLGKTVKSVAAKRVAATFVAAPSSD
jgi:hypothetical protein